MCVQRRLPPNGEPEHEGHPSDPCARVGLETAILKGHTILLQFLFVSLGKSTSDLLATNACYASEFGKASWQAAVQMIDISALVKYAKCIGLEIMFVDIHDYAGGLRYGLGWQARAYGIASQMGLLFMRYPQASPHRHRKLLPSAETLQYHNELRSWTCGEELRQVVYVYHFNVSDLPVKLQQLYAPEQRRWRQILKMGVMKHWRYIFTSVPNVVSSGLGMFVRRYGLQ